MRSPPVGLTRRQQIVEVLAERECGFEALRAELGLSVRVIEDDLRHVAKSLHRGPRRLVVTPSRCHDCGFEFRNRAPRHFHTPSRCPRCRGEGIADARFHVVEPSGRRER